jgi:hypothetical protein
MMPKTLAFKVNKNDTCWYYVFCWKTIWPTDIWATDYKEYCQLWGEKPSEFSNVQHAYTNTP